MPYKLTTQDMTTHNGFKWELGKKYMIDKPGNAMCTDQVFHFYDYPEIALLFNSRHADIFEPRIFKIKCNKVAHDGIKGGAKWMILENEIEMPKLTTLQKVAFAIFCTLEVYKEEKYVKWANDWLSGKDRTYNSAASAAASAAYAANSAAYAAYAAAYAAAANYAAYASNAAAYASNDKRKLFELSIKKMYAWTITEEKRVKP